jgi:hypothetical protein
LPDPARGIEGLHCGPEEATMFELRVMSGLHQGAALPLIGDRWVVGAQEDSDLVLYDPGILTQHLVPAAHPRAMDARAFAGHRL